MIPRLARWPKAGCAGAASHRHMRHSQSRRMAGLDQGVG